MARHKTTTCTYHCSQCGRHFHSLTSFDAHQRDDENRWPVCLSPFDVLDRDDKERLVALTEHGECRMMGLNANGSPREDPDATIWTLAGFEKARELGDQMSLGAVEQAPGDTGAHPSSRQSPAPAE